MPKIITMLKKEDYLNMMDAIIASDDPVEKDRLYNQIIAEADSNKEEFEKAYREHLDRTLQKCDDILLRQNLDFILKSMNLTFIAKEYFGKSHAWLSQRINGNLVNGKPAQFTDEDKQKLKNALEDISRRVLIVAERL